MSYGISIAFFVVGMISMCSKVPPMECLGLFAVSGLFAIAGEISNSASVTYLEGKIQGAKELKMALDEVLNKAEKEEK